MAWGRQKWTREDLFRDEWGPLSGSQRHSPHVLPAWWFTATLLGPRESPQVRESHLLRGTVTGRIFSGERGRQEIPLSESDLESQQDRRRNRKSCPKRPAQSRPLAWSHLCGCPDGLRAPAWSGDRAGAGGLEERRVGDNLRSCPGWDMTPHFLSTSSHYSEIRGVSSTYEE